MPRIGANLMRRPCGSVARILLTVHSKPEARPSLETPEMHKTLLSLGAAIALGALPVAARAQHSGHDGHDHGHAASSGGSHAAQAGHTHEITVTSDGFVPANITVRRGESVKLIVTRKTDRTCAKEIVIKDYGINQPLPLDKPVTIELTPKKSGQVRYACGMDMITGVLVID